MALEGFIPQLWSGVLLERLQKSTVFGAVANRDYEGEIAGYGGSVKINQIGVINVSTYTYDSTSLTVQAIDDAQKELKIDQAKYFAFKVDDVVNAQMRPKIMTSAMADAAYRLRDNSDAYMAGLYAQCGVLVDNAGSAYAVTSVNVTEIIGLTAQKLNETNTPLEGRWMIVPPWFHQKMVLARIALDTANTNTIDNGRVGRYLGFDFYISNNISEGTPSTHTNCRLMAGYGGSLTFAEQLLKVEAYRPEATFHDAVKGLYVYGAIVNRPDTCARVYATYAAEP